MSSLQVSLLKKWLGNRLSKRLDWAAGAAPDAGQAAMRALVMAASWTVLTFIVVHWLILSQRGFGLGLLSLHLLAAAVGGFLVLLIIGTLLMNILMMLPPGWLLDNRQIRKWGTAVGLAVFTTGVTHVTMWALEGVAVHELMPLSVMVPHLLGGLIGWGLIQELAEIRGVE